MFDAVLRFKAECTGFGDIRQAVDDIARPGFIIDDFRFIAGETDDASGQLVNGDAYPAADIEHAGSIALGGKDVCVYYIVNVSKVPGLFPVPEDD